MATERMERAELVGPANAMKFEGERIIVDNFDGVGIVNDIQQNLGYPLAGRRVLMLGAGGAARGALLSFLSGRPAELVIANRTVSKAQGLAEQFRQYGALPGCGYPGLERERFDMLSNGT